MKETWIAEELNSLGMSHKIKGHQACRTAVAMILDAGFKPEIRFVYEAAAERLKTDSANVERNIRYAVEKTWETGDWEAIDRTFGLTVDRERGKPTNSEFLFLIADRVKNRMKQERDA